MTTIATRRLLLSLPDVAALARVQRPVVSMWRSRAAGSGAPFPVPAERTDHQELFDLDDVVDWLATTGRGNNPNVREEGALFAALDALPASLRGQVVDGLTALLALKSTTGADFAELTGADLLDLADDADPHDDHLYRELDALGDDLTWWAGHAAAMASAAFTPADAFEAVLSHRHRLGLHEHAETLLNPWATDLVARIAVELVDPELRAATTFVDPSGAGALLVAVRRTLGELDRPTVALPTGAARSARLARRRLVTHGWHVTEAVPDDAGRITWPAGSLVLTQFPNPTTPVMSDHEIITAVEDIALAMHDDDRAVLIAPASALVNRTRRPAVSGTRAEALRTGRVRAMLRLPAGLWPSRSRQQLAVWVLGSAQDVARADRWVTVADLANAPVDRAVTQDVITDVIAALGDRDAVRGHAFRFGRLTPTSELVAASGDLISGAHPAVHRPRRSPAETAVAVQHLAARAAAPSSGPVLRLDVEHHEPGAVQLATLGELVARRGAVVVAGNRLDPAHVGAGAGVPVIGPDEVLGARRRGERSIDRLTLSTHYPAGRYTEPGDVVFCSTPAIGAVVDAEGFSVVLAPARVLRLNRTALPGLVPDVVARAVRSAPAGSGWRSWTVHLVPAAQAVPLEAVLTAVAAVRSDLAERLAALDELTATLTEAVTTGSLTLNSPTSPVDDPAEQEG